MSGFTHDRVIFYWPIGCYVTSLWMANCVSVMKKNPAKTSRFAYA